MAYHLVDIQKIQPIIFYVVLLDNCCTFDNFTSRYVFDQLEMNFEKLKEDFVKKYPNNIKFLKFIHRYHILEDLNEYLQPIFSYFVIPYFSHYFWAQIPRRWRGICEK